MAAIDYRFEKILVMDVNTGAKFASLDIVGSYGFDIPAVNDLITIGDTHYFVNERFFNPETKCITLMVSVDLTYRRYRV